MRVLVVGMGASAFGREQRAVRILREMPVIEPYFLISKWEDGSVSRLLEENGLEYGHAPWGYLGRAKPSWTLVTILHLPLLLFRVVSVCLSKRCRRILFLSEFPLLNALPAFLPLAVVGRIPLHFYFGDIPRPDLARRLLGRLMNRCGRSFVANSESVKRGLVRLGIPAERIQVIYNGVAVERFASAVPEDFRARYGWDSGEVLFAYAGQLNAHKGVEDFVAAAALAVRREPSCRFLVFGQLNGAGGYPQRLAGLADSLSLNGRLRFAGWAPRIEEALAGVDVVIVPSRYDDPAPNVVLEAMACGKPVIATRAGGIPELVRDGETGLLVARQDPQQLAAAVMRMASEPGLRRRLGRAALLHCRTRFDSRANSLEVKAVLVDG